MSNFAASLRAKKSAADLYPLTRVITATRQWSWNCTECSLSVNYHADHATFYTPQSKFLGIPQSWCQTRDKNRTILSYDFRRTKKLSDKSCHTHVTSRRQKCS